ncbi:unnamed protein product [Schistosoma curassoni]|uniref:Uncharacterized protein n=1 Tax=Schistosoma curassoni TaxID=6186 RepID=A0A183JZH2_9TREM|nr:unnamed protein product [Schistosoma curassoni]
MFHGLLKKSRHGCLLKRNVMVIFMNNTLRCIIPM